MVQMWLSESKYVERADPEEYFEFDHLVTDTADVEVTNSVVPLTQISAYITQKNSVVCKSVQALRMVYAKCLRFVERNVWKDNSKGQNEKHVRTMVTVTRLSVNHLIDNLTDRIPQNDLYVGNSLSVDFLFHSSTPLEGNNLSCLTTTSRLREKSRWHH